MIHWLSELIVICLMAGMGVVDSQHPDFATWKCGPGSQAGTMEVEGSLRRFKIHVPGTLKNPTPLIIALHGHSLRSEDMEATSQLSILADKQGFIVVYPQAQGVITEWDLRPGLDNPDAAFISLLIDELEDQCNIDPGQVFVTGFSNGGGMTHRLACMLSEKIAAIAPVSGTYVFDSNCPTSKPVPVMAFHGDADASATYGGEKGGTISVPEWAAGWAQRNGCSSSFEWLSGSAGIVHQKWQACPPNGDVHLITLNGGGHIWPRTDWGGQGYSGLESPVNASEMMWSFFDSLQTLP